MVAETVEKAGFGQKILNAVKSFWARLNGLPAQSSAVPNIPQTEAIDKPSLDEDRPYDEYVTKISGMDDIIVRMGLHERISASHKYMYEMGRRDGALGIKMNITGIAAASAQAMFRHIYVILTGKIGSLKVRLESEQKIMQKEEVFYNRDQLYYDYLKYQYRLFPKSHSLLLFAIYSVVAIALIIADMPLALDLIRKGFDLPGSGYENLFIEGQFWSTIAGNWETSLTALGVTLCTVYVKIFYDEFVGTPYGNKLMMSEKFIEENAIEGSEKNLSIVKQEHMFKALIKVIIFLGTLLAILFLAEFRYETAKMYDMENFNATPIKHGAFVAITLLFPVIGGICLSYALNNLQNRLRYARSERKYLASKNILLKAVESYTTAKSNYEDITSAAEILNDEIRMVEEYRNQLLAFYHRGYAIGSMQPEKYARDENFFDKIQEWRNIAIARKINHHIGKLN
jgi:hypothetical protein